MTTLFSCTGLQWRCHCSPTNTVIRTLVWPQAQSSSQTILCHQQISVLCSVPIYLHVYVCMCAVRTQQCREQRKKSVLCFIPCGHTCGHLRCAKSQCTVIWQQPFLLSRKIEPIRMKYNEEMGCLSVKKPHPSTSAADETGSNVITHTERREFKNLAEFPKERQRQRDFYLGVSKKKKKKPTKKKKHRPPSGLCICMGLNWRKRKMREGKEEREILWKEDESISVSHINQRQIVFG